MNENNFKNIAEELKDIADKVNEKRCEEALSEIIHNIILDGSEVASKGQYAFVLEPSDEKYKVLYDHNLTFAFLLSQRFREKIGEMGLKLSMYNGDSYLMEKYMISFK